MDNIGKKVAAEDAEDAKEEKGDKYLNWKNAEFYLYSIFSITTIFEEVTVQFEIQPTIKLADALNDHAEAEGVDVTAAIVFSNNDLKEEIKKVLHEE